LSSNIYIDYMNQHVFAPLSIPTSACKPTEPNEILSYPFPPGSAHGVEWDDNTLTCGPGGWRLKASDLFKIINDLATGNVLLTNSEKSLMTNPDCLGWDCAVRPDCPNPYDCKNGAQFEFPTPSATPCATPTGVPTPIPFVTVFAYAGIFKSQPAVPVVVYVNSALPTPYQPFNNEGIPYNVACTAPGIPNSCCTGQGTGTCMLCPAGQGEVCNTDIIGLVGDAYAASSCQSTGQFCNTEADCCSSQLCLSNQCYCSAVGQSCSYNSDCCSGSCSGEVCQCRPLAGCGKRVLEALGGIAKTPYSAPIYAKVTE
jgi:hypothetical protein